MNRPPRSAVQSSGQSERPQLTEEEVFEDVGLNDDPKLLPKKKRIFSRFGDNHEMSQSTENSRPNSSHRGFHIPGRKRGHSGQGAELGKIDRTPPKLEDDGIINWFHWFAHSCVSSCLALLGCRSQGEGSRECPVMGYVISLSGAYERRWSFWDTTIAMKNWRQKCHLNHFLSSCIVPFPDKFQTTTKPLSLRLSNKSAKLL